MVSDIWSPGGQGQHQGQVDFGEAAGRMVGNASPDWSLERGTQALLLCGQEPWACRLSVTVSTVLAEDRTRALVNCQAGFVELQFSGMTSSS